MRQGQGRRGAALTQGRWMVAGLTAALIVCAWLIAAPRALAATTGVPPVPFPPPVCSPASVVRAFCTPPKPRPSGVGLPGFSHGPQVNNGVLMLYWRCPSTTSACTGTARIVITDSGHKLALHPSRIHVAVDRQAIWLQRLPASWRNRLQHHRGHLKVTVNGETIFNGKLT